MKVKELIKKLDSLDPNLDIYGICEDALIDSEEIFLMFDIDSIDLARVVTTRDSNSKPVITFKSGKDSREMAFLNLTSVF